MWSVLVSVRKLFVRHFQYPSRECNYTYINVEKKVRLVVRCIDFCGLFIVKLLLLLLWLEPILRPKMYLLNKIRGCV